MCVCDAPSLSPPSTYKTRTCHVETNPPPGFAGILQELRAEALDRQRNEEELQRAAWPQIHGDVYVGVLGTSHRDSFPMQFRYDMRAVQAVPREIRIRLSPMSMHDRSLVELRDARAMAGLDTTELDEGIAWRTIIHSGCWGDLGIVMYRLYGWAFWSALNDYVARREAHR